MSVQNLLEKMKNGKKEEIEVSGTKLLIQSPKMQETSRMLNILRKFEEGEKVNFNEIAQIIIDNTFDPKTEERCFSKGDLSTLVEDRYGIVPEIITGLINLVVSTEEDKEKTKKK